MMSTVRFPGVSRCCDLGFCMVLRTSGDLLFIFGLPERPLHGVCCISYFLVEVFERIRVLLRVRISCFPPGRCVLWLLRAGRPDARRTKGKVGVEGKKYLLLDSHKA